MVPGPFRNKLSGARACGAGVEKSSLTSGRCANPKRAVAIVGLGFGASIRAPDLRAHQLLHGKEVHTRTSHAERKHP